MIYIYIYCLYQQGSNFLQKHHLKFKWQAPFNVVMQHHQPSNVWKRRLSTLMPLILTKIFGAIRLRGKCFDPHRF